MEAKTDLARLQEVRARREAAAAQRKAEAEGESPSLQTLYGAHDCLRNTEKAQEAAAKKEKLLAKKIWPATWTRVLFVIDVKVTVRIECLFLVSRIISYPVYIGLSSCKYESPTYSDL